MKKRMTTAIFTLVAALAFANEPTAALPLSASDLPLEKKTQLAEMPSSNDGSFTYLRMGVTDSYPADSVQVVPGLGLGYRMNVGSGAVDLSANYTRGNKEGAYFYTVPKASYFQYLTPKKNQSLYAGAGLAYGGLKSKSGTEFQGLVPSATLGFEMNRKSNWHSFAQFDVSQPALTFNSKTILGTPDTYPGPIAELSFGAGF